MRFSPAKEAQILGHFYEPGFYLGQIQHKAGENVAIIESSCTDDTAHTILQQAESERSLAPNSSLSKKPNCCDEPGAWQAPGVRFCENCRDDER
jgi:hypothetical protein